MIDPTDWDRWRGSWQQPELGSIELEEAMARFQRAKRREATVRVAEWTIVAVAIAFPIAAMRHAANALEATLGIGAVVVVLGIAIFRAWNRRAERAALGTSAREFDSAVRGLRLAELRFVRFLWLVLGLEGVFFAIWWYGGLAIHDGWTSLLAIGSLWLPLLGAALVLVWSLRLRADALRELTALRSKEALARQVDVPAEQPG